MMSNPVKLMGEGEIFVQDFENFKLYYVGELDVFKIRDIYYYACKRNTVDVVKSICENLIVHKFFKNIFPNYHTQGFKYACDGNNLDVMNYLYDNYVIDLNIFNYFILNYPCRMGYFDVVKFIVENFPNLNYRPYREELIICCLSRNHYKILYYLKSRYPDLDKGINYKNHGISSQNVEFREWFEAGCPIYTNMKPASKK